MKERGEGEGNTLRSILLLYLHVFIFQLFFTFLPPRQQIFIITPTQKFIPNNVLTVTYCAGHFLKCSDLTVTTPKQIIQNVLSPFLDIPILLIIFTPPSPSFSPSSLSLSLLFSLLFSLSLLYSHFYNLPREEDSFCISSSEPAMTKTASKAIGNSDNEQATAMRSKFK